MIRDLNMDNNFLSFNRNNDSYHSACCCLPPPNASAYATSLKLQEIIISEINKNNGALNFADYMRLALYCPEMGYYSGNLQKFGADGDFITACEISPLFSQCIATLCAFTLEQVGSGGNILEIGAGTGEMATEILLSLSSLQSLPEKYYIYEISSQLKKRQEEKFKLRFHGKPELLSRIHWIDNPKALAKFKGIILANEVLDALPVHRFHIKDKKIFETHVGINNNKLVFQDVPTQRPEFQALFEDLISAGFDEHMDYTSEFNLNLKSWLNPFSQTLQQGIMLLIDYGFPRHEYYHHDRNMGTLMCHYQHHSHHDPLLYPGLQDITTHVDFTAVAQAALETNLELLGFTTQSHFLINAGLLQCAEKQNYRAGSIEQASLSQAINMLTSPAEMGELFKVIALGKGMSNKIPGFQYDMRHRL